MYSQGRRAQARGTLLSRLQEQDDRLFYSISATTRAPRPGETDGVQYYFLSKAEFEEENRAACVSGVCMLCGELLWHTRSAGQRKAGAGL